MIHIQAVNKLPLAIGSFGATQMISGSTSDIIAEIVLVFLVRKIGRDLLAAIDFKVMVLLHLRYKELAIFLYKVPICFSVDSRAEQIQLTSQCRVLSPLPMDH